MAEVYAVGNIDSADKGSGARANSGKPDWSLMPLDVLTPVVRVWGVGAAKYAAWNWAKGMPWSVPLACLLRHAAAYQRGETLDHETGESHMAHVICNAMMLMHYERFYPEGDDRPKEFFNAETDS